MSLFSRIFYDCQLSVNCQLFRPRLSVMILNQVHSSNWLNACTVPEKFRSIAHSPEEKELTDGDPVLRASDGAY